MLRSSLNRRRGQGIYDGPFITQHALFGKRPILPKYGVGRKPTVYVSRMGMGRSRKRGGNILGQIHNYVKSKRLISKGLHALSKNVSNPTLSKIAQVARNFSATQGYGRRRRRRRQPIGMGRKRTVGIPTHMNAGMGRRRRRKRGGSIFTDIGDFLKKHKVLSTIGKAVTPFSGAFNPLVSGATQYAESQGYGRKRRIGGSNPYPTTNSFHGVPRF